MKRRQRKMGAGFNRLRLTYLLIAVMAIACVVLVNNGPINGEKKEAAQEQAAQAEADAAAKKAAQAAAAKTMSQLQTDVNATLASTDGTWSVYVKDLKNDTSFTINDQPLYAASLIKLFVLESSYKNYHQLLENAGGDTAYLNQTLSNMITVSDNEAFNELVRLHSDSYSFNEGCQTIEDWLKSSGEYPNTNVYHSLEPSNTPLSYISVESNTTSAADCGKLLEKIYKGTCVSENASADMLSFLKAQEKTGKIPAGLPEGTVSANKTGETDTEQHDAAIVYGDKTDYVICIMSSGFSDGGAAVSTIQTISSQVYNALEGTGA